MGAGTGSSPTSARTICICLKGLAQLLRSLQHLMYVTPFILTPALITSTTLTVGPRVGTFLSRVTDAGGRGCGQCGHGDRRDGGSAPVHLFLLGTQHRHQPPPAQLSSLQPPYICTAVTDNVQYTAVSAVSPASWLLSQCNPPKDFCNYNIA